MNNHHINELVTYDLRLQNMTKIGQGHDFHDSELIQDEYLRNLEMIDHMDEGSDTDKIRV